jgi:hypothetical protein
LNGVQMAALARTDRVNIVRLELDGGQQAIMAWGRTGEFAQVRVSATDEQSTLFDQYGKIVMLWPMDGHYVLSLPGARCNQADGCPVGGMVALLVQPQGDITVEEIMPGANVPLAFE